MNQLTLTKSKNNVYYFKQNTITKLFNTIFKR